MKQLACLHQVSPNTQTLSHGSCPRLSAFCYTLLLIASLGQLGICRADSKPHDWVNECESTIKQYVDARALVKRGETGTHAEDSLKSKDRIFRGLKHFIDTHPDEIVKYYVASTLIEQHTIGGLVSAMMGKKGHAAKSCASRLNKKLMTKNPFFLSEQTHEQPDSISEEAKAFLHEEGQELRQEVQRHVTEIANAGSVASLANSATKSLQSLTTPLAPGQAASDKKISDNLKKPSNPSDSIGPGSHKIRPVNPQGQDAR